MSNSWRDWGEARPIRVENGIKAKSKRGAIGEQWWSQRFLSVLESYGMSGRLARGRSYARAGQVLDFQLAQGKVTAQVQGSRPRPYQVKIGVLPLTTAQWRRVQDRLASQALFRAKLLAGEMPHEIEEVFEDCGTPLFPRLASDLDMRCSCPDWGVPCKHLAAVCYVLAEEFDHDPFGLLAWRGKGRDELLAALRALQAAAGGSTAAKGSSAARGGTAAEGGTAAQAARSAGSAAAAPSAAVAAAPPAGAQPGAGWRASLDVPAVPLAECLDTFWSPGLSPARLRALSTAPSAAAPDLLLRMVPPPPLQVRGKDLAEILTPAYGQLGADDTGPGTPPAEPTAG
jgi:uncharacterized Zn finger protein